MTKVLGIDPGTAITGWAVLEEKKGKITPLAYGCINTRPIKTTSQRLKELAGDLKKIINRHQPDESAVEDIFFFKNLKTAVKVSQARGAILLTLEEKKVKIFEYTPLEVKQSVAGYGRAEKKQVQYMVKGILNLKSVPQSDDAADAIAVALCHINSRKFLKLSQAN